MTSNRSSIPPSRRPRIWRPSWQNSVLSSRRDSRLQEPPPYGAAAGPANDAAELLAPLPVVQQLAAKAFPNAQDAITAFQPTLNFARAYTPDIFNGFGKLGLASGYYDGNGNYVRVPTVRPESVHRQRRHAGTDQAKSTVRTVRLIGGINRRCPGGATQSAPDDSNPFVEPPFAGSGVTTSQCNPADAPPGP